MRRCDDNGDAGVEAIYAREEAGLCQKKKSLGGISCIYIENDDAEWNK